TIAVLLAFGDDDPPVPLQLVEPVGNSANITEAPQVAAAAVRSALDKGLGLLATGFVEKRPLLVGVRVDRDGPRPSATVGRAIAHEEIRHRAADGRDDVLSATPGVVEEQDPVVSERASPACRY